MEKSALFVIDMQIGAVTLEHPKFHQIDELVVRLKKLIEKARLENLPVIYAQHHNKEGFISSKQLIVSTPLVELHLIWVTKLY